MGRGGARFAFACALTFPRPSRSSSEHSPPPRPLYGLLRLYRSRPGLCPLRLLLERLRRFSRLSACEQFSAEVIALPFGLFAPPLLLGHPFAQRGLCHFAADTFGVELILDSLSGFCRLLWLRCGELAHGHGLLHDDLVFAAVLVPKIGHFIPELRYECVTVRVYPFVLPAVYPSSSPCVHVDIYTTIVFLFMLQGSASHPFAHGSLGHPERSSRFLDGKTVYPSSIPCVHSHILDH